MEGGEKWVEGSCLNSVIYRVEMEAVIRRNGLWMGALGGWLGGGGEGRGAEGGRG